MRIVIDLQGAQCGSRHRGIGRYSQALAKAIARNRGAHDVFILLNELFPEDIDDIKMSFSGLIPDRNFIVFSAAGPVDELPIENSWRVRAAELLYEKFINDLRPDVLLISSLIEGASDNTVVSIGRLFPRVKTAVILYDLIPYINPEKYIGWEPAKKWYYGKIDSLKRADLLLAISNSARCEAIDFLKVSQDRAVNISSAVDTSFVKKNLSHQERSKLYSRFHIKRKFLMHSSAFDERKNFEGLIRAFGALPKDLRADYQLVLVCKINEAGKNKLHEIAFQCGLKKDDLVLTGFVSDDELIALYSECYLFVFPSFHEGFGLPALEAMCCGAPTIGSNTTSVPEVIGRADALFDPNSTESMSGLIERILRDNSFWGALKDHAETQSKLFSWDRSALVAIEALEELHTQNINTITPIDVRDNFYGLIERLSALNCEATPSDIDFVKTAEAIDKNNKTTSRIHALPEYNGRLKWRIEGPFDSTYSLALLNRETARALDTLGHFVVLHSTEGPGDFPANSDFLNLNPDIARMHSRVSEYSQHAVDVTSRNLYPPRVVDMQSPINMLHHYAWEESGFPHNWVNNFNSSLHGITCLSNHVEKILIDNGVAVPMLTSGCGVDHWERITPASDYQLEAKKFRFLHVSSCFPRKGVDLLLDAYAQAFSSNDDVTLVIKTFENPHNEIWNWIAERRAGNSKFPDVRVIIGDLSDAELKALYQSCHVLVAPSKAEGFGLPMAEAMLSGLPVITTAWGGQLEFCNEDNSWLVDYEFEYAKTHFGIYASAWAKVNVADLAKTLVEVRNSAPEYLASKALAGRDLLLSNFKWTDVVANAINAVHTWKSRNYPNPINNIGWISSWNTKCGIATYSDHLISNMGNAKVKILAPKINQDQRTHEDNDSCIRCWTQGKDDNDFFEMEKEIQKNDFNVIIIQFNYGFYNFQDLNDLICKQLDAGRIVIVMLHSTVDPFNGISNWMLSELKDTLARCHRVLVHSIADMNNLKKINLVDNVALFPHGMIACINKEAIVEKDTLPLIASYGFCLPHKGLAELIESIGILKNKGRPVRLRMVNAEYPDPISSKLIVELRNLISTIGVGDLVQINTDYLDDGDSLSLLSAADLLVFPYQKTGESSSAAVRYGLATKRPIAVTPLNIFDDVGNAVFRFGGVSAEDIANGIDECLHELSSNSEMAQCIQLQAQKWREQHDYAAIGKRLNNICSALLQKNQQKIYRYSGSSPQLRTVVGDIQGRSLLTTGVAGNLMHGPYLKLVAGKYKVMIHGDVRQNGDGSARIDIAMDQGRSILAETIFADSPLHGCIACLTISLDQPCTDLEVRIWVSDISQLQISMIEIAPWKDE